MVLSDVLGTYRELDKDLPENISLGPSHDVLRTSKMIVLRTSEKVPDTVLIKIY
jgi:hypothetical protein